MPLQKILFKPGVNRENTRYTTEGGWYDCDKIRFRQGTPEKIGGWARISATTFLGVCRSLWNWVTLGSQNLLGVGTNLKFYIENGGFYNDITPLRKTAATLGNNPFSTTNLSTTVTVTDATGGYANGAYVTFSGATAVGGLDLNGEYQLSTVGTSTTTYTITAATAATSTAVGGGASVLAAYQVNPGPAYAVPLTGWGAGAWGSGTWGIGSTSVDALRIWNQNNFGQNLVFGPRGGGLYYWDATSGLTSRGVLVSSLGGASGVPLYQNYLLVSDISRFVLLFGTNELGDTILDPMLIRWSDQEDILEWTPSITNQAGSVRLSHGSRIVTALQSRQEIIVWTDSSLYSLQYLGPPYVWSSQLLADNISIVGPNAATIASGVTYWMGVDKFYKYDGRTQTLRCDLREYIFSDINQSQYEQVFASTNEGFNEVWFFYCSANSFTVDKYVVYNYEEDVWYYGTMARTAWLDSGLRNYPIAATYQPNNTGNIVNHEQGVDDSATATTLPIEAYITSSEFDIGDGHNFGFVWRILPDLTFRGSTATSPQATMYLMPLQNSGSGYNDPASVGGSDNGVVTRTAVIPVEQFTGQINTRVRGRQMAFKIDSDALGVTWQLGAPRMDIRPDGRRGG
jgi:hypothetical protein